MESNQTFTISAYTENNIGILNRISAIFQRRHINIDSINSSVSEITGVSRITLVVQITETQIRKIISQIEKQVEVIKAFYHLDEETVCQESCLFKLRSNLLMQGDAVQDIIIETNARIVTVNKDFFVLEKSGSPAEINALHEKLSPHTIMQFVRSGRIAITKNEMKITEMLSTFQA